MSSLWEPTAPWKSFSKQRICWKGPIGGEICLWHRAGHGGRVWCINNQSSRRGAGAQPTLFSTHQRSLSEWGHCKSAPLLLLQPHIVMPRSTYTVPFSLSHVWDGLISQSGCWGERGKTRGIREREIQQTLWHLICVYFTTHLSLVKLFALLSQTFQPYGCAELKTPLNWHWVSNLITLVQCLSAWLYGSSVAECVNQTDVMMATGKRSCFRGCARLCAAGV